MKKYVHLVCYIACFWVIGINLTLLAAEFRLI
jgi:hypothetical protein